MSANKPWLHSETLSKTKIKTKIKKKQKQKLTNKMQKEKLVQLGKYEVPMTVPDNMGVSITVSDSQPLSPLSALTAEDKPPKPSFSNVSYCRCFSVAHCWPLSGVRN